MRRSGGGVRLRSAVRWLAAAVAIGVGLGAGGCRTPLYHAEAGTFERKPDHRPEPYERRGVLEQIALFLPNRIVDALEIAHVSVGVGVPLGVDVRLTRWVQLGASANFGVGVGWNGRDSSPEIYTASYTAAIGPARTGTGSGRVLPIKDWEVGVDLVPFKVAVDLSEVLDFVLGWFYVDIKQDDWGWD